MIEFIKGTIVSLTPTDVVIETSGIGYLLNITLSTYSSLEGQSDIKLLVHEIIREDTHELYGFSEERERKLFRALIGVSGVGPNTARVILSAIPTQELESVIIAGDHRRLTSAKGIGAKTAQRIIVDLRDKIKNSDSTLINQPVDTTETYSEALAALVMLGFPRPAAQKALDKVFKANPLVKVEEAIKKALSML